MKSKMPKTCENCHLRLRSQLDEIHKMVEAIYKQMFPTPTGGISPARIISIKERARRKALEIKNKLNLK